MTERAHVDNGIAIEVCMTCAVCAPVIYSKWTFEIVKVLYTSANFLDCCSVGVHARGNDAYQSCRASMLVASCWLKLRQGWFCARESTRSNKMREDADATSSILSFRAKISLDIFDSVSLLLVTQPQSCTVMACEVNYSARVRRLSVWSRLPGFR
jgi:hypothetical protein